MSAVIVILVLLVIGAAAVIIAPKLFQIEKVEIDSQPDIEFPSEEGGADTDEASALPDLDDGVSLKEKMGLPEESDGDEEANGEEAPPEDDNAALGQKRESQPTEGRAEDRFAETDRLTNLKIGRGYLIACQKVLTQAKSQKITYGAACFDFDRFRFINSLKGQIGGDYVITRSAQELENIFPPGALITRLSADHFAAVFPVVDSEMCGPLDEALKQMCEKLRGDMAIKGALRISMGVAFTDGEPDYDIRILLHKANIARHCIKISRSETYRLYDASMLSSYLFGESALEDYGENQYDEEIAFYYTPIEDTSLHVLSHCEALARWRCEDEVDKSLPYSMSKNMLPTNSSKIIYQVCKAMSRWRKAGKQIPPVLVPVPPTEFFQSDLDEFIAKVLSEFQLEPGLLSLVIDAPMARLDWSAVCHQVKRLSDVGVKVGVDEIDIGYLDLNFLSELPVHFVKLHQSFLQRTEEGGINRGRLSQIAGMAKGQNKLVFVEGVDTQEQANQISELGIRYIQGAYSGRPQKAERFSQGLQDYVEPRSSEGTVILDDASLNQGDYTIY